MANPCGKGRCPARADVYDHNTTEYRKGCRRTPCTAAHTLAEQRRKTKKAEEAAKAAAAVIISVDQLGSVFSPRDEHPGSPELPGVDLVGRVVRDLDELDPDHPLKRTLGGVALSLAQEVEFLVRAPTRSAAPAARALIEVLERLMPTKRGGLEEELARLFAEDDDQPATADDEPARPE